MKVDDIINKWASGEIGTTQAIALLRIEKARLEAVLEENSWADDPNLHIDPYDGGSPYNEAIIAREVSSDCRTDLAQAEEMLQQLENFTEPVPPVVGEGQTTPHIAKYVKTMIDEGIIEEPRGEEYKGKYRILVTLKEFIVYLQDNNIPLNTDVICRDYIQKDNAPVSRNTLKKYKYRDYN